MPRGIFITGTSTGVGKTLVSAALLRLAARYGVRTVGLKPVATGGELDTAGRLRNTDALELQAAGSVRIDYALVNPFCFEPAIAPHIAARESGRPIHVADLVEWYGHATVAAELAVVEGAGGWRVPLYPTGFLSDLPESLHLDVILVVGLTLGCLNHARLTAEAIHAGGRCRLLGWISNAIDPTFQRAAENVESLAELLGSPPLAQVPWLGRDPGRTVCDPPVCESPDDRPLLIALGLAAKLRENSR